MANENTTSNHSDWQMIHTCKWNRCVCWRACGSVRLWRLYAWFAMREKWKTVTTALLRAKQTINVSWVYSNAICSRFVVVSVGGADGGDRIFVYYRSACAKICKSNYRIISFIRQSTHFNFLPHRMNERSTSPTWSFILLESLQDNHQCLHHKYMNPWR